MATQFDNLIQQKPNPNTLGGGMPPTNIPPSVGAMPPPIGSSAPSIGSTPPSTGATPPKTSMATPQQMAELDKLFKSVQTANSKLVSGSIIDRNKVSGVRKDLMTKLFGVMKDAGVDLSKPESIRQFMEQLSKDSPDLLTMFEMAFQGLNSNPTDAIPTQKPDPIGQGLNQSTSTTDSSSGASTPPENPVVDRFQNLARLGQNSGA